MAIGKEKRLRLYVRAGCHLCDEMRVELLSMRSARAFLLEEIDIGARPELESRYGVRIPVLESPQGELCHHFLNRKAVIDYLSIV